MWHRMASAVLLVSLAGFGVQAQDETKQEVNFPTVDKVNLSGTYFRGSKGINSPAVMLVHRFNSDSSKGGWMKLAKDLQDKGYAVLAFDLRGHGKSTRIDDTKAFWNAPHNRGGLRGGTATKQKSEISVADFKANYWPVLVNDLVAARYFLDQQNDAQTCNSKSIFVIGAQEGAALGMCWQAYEWDRRSIAEGTAIYSVGTTPHVPGEDVAGGIWLGPVMRAGSVNFKPADWFNKSSRLREKVPQYFIYGKQDSNSASAVPSILAAAKRTPDDIRKKHAFDKEEPLNTKLPGQDLVGNEALQINDKIVKYMDQVQNDMRKSVVWKESKPSIMQLVPLTIYGFNSPG